MRKGTKKHGAQVVLAVVLVAAVLFAGLYIILQYSDTGSETGNPVTVHIEEGSSAKMIAQVLKENGLIKSEQLFLMKLKSSPYADQLKYGDFNLHTGMSMADMIEKLAGNSDGAKNITLTIPEGFSAEMIALRAEELGICGKQDFLDALDDDYDYAFLQDIPNNLEYKYKLQGFLFPNTYSFLPDTPAHDVVNVLLGEFANQYGKVSGSNSSGYSLYDVMTVASLVEREAKLKEEQGTIAGVIYNRLDKDMILQIDATVVYAITDGLYDVDVVLYKDLEVDSPYNTYKYKGLPIGPICNPGIEAIAAAMNPDKNSYLYYHTDETKQDGSHIFTQTLDEHNSTMNN